MNKTNRSLAPQATEVDSLDPQTDALAYTPRPSASSQDAGIVTRAALVVVLSLTLVGAMRWALNITNANARQISTGLTRLQGEYDVRQQGRQAAGLRPDDGFPMPRPSHSSLSNTKESSNKESNSKDGPSIEPEGR